jgi:peptidase E
VAGDSLQAIAFMDDPNVTAPGYSPGEPICEGLGLVPYTIIPHFRSAHPEAAAAEKATEWVTARRVQHRTLQDGDVLLANGGETVLLKRRGMSKKARISNGSRVSSTQTGSEGACASDAESLLPTHFRH